MFLLLIIVMSSISSFSMASEKQWTIHKKENKVTQDKNIQEKNTSNQDDLSEFFKLMHPESQLRKVCLSRDYSQILKNNGYDYHCRAIANMLYCATKTKTAAHKAYCDHADVKSYAHDNWNETYHTSQLAREYALPPKQTTKEIELFLETMAELSK